MPALALQSVEQEIVAAERELEPEEKALRLWHRMRVRPQQWNQEQYPISQPFWVIAILGTRCLYHNPLENGWGWGGYQTPGHISEYHWQQDDIHHVVLQTPFCIENGGHNGPR